MHREGYTIVLGPAINCSGLQQEILLPSMQGMEKLSTCLNVGLIAMIIETKEFAVAILLSEPDAPGC